MAGWTAYESGTAWCESAYKYQTVSVVAEFANSLSALPIIVMPLLGVAILRRYVEEVNWELMLPALLCAFNGVASAYYHATLNLLGQLIDEISLLWLAMSCMYISLPTMKYISQGARKHVNTIRFFMVLATVLITGLCFVRPWLNSFALMATSVPGIVLVHYEAKIAETEKARYLERRVFVLWTTAMSFWAADRLFCDFWLRLGTPYGHAIFHVLSSVAAYFIYLLFVLLDIERRRSQHKFDAQMRFFPSEKFPILPYISLHERKQRRM